MTNFITAHQNFNFYESLLQKPIWGQGAFPEHPASRQQLCDLGPEGIFSHKDRGRGSRELALLNWVLDRTALQEQDALHPGLHHQIEKLSFPCILSLTTKDPAGPNPPAILKIRSAYMNILHVDMYISKEKRRYSHSWSPAWDKNEKGNRSKNNVGAMNHYAHS